MNDEPEAVDAVPVLDEPGALARRPEAAVGPVAMQAAAVGAASFVAGAAAVAMVRHRRVRRVRRARKALGPVLASRSFLVDVHVLGDRK